MSRSGFVYEAYGFRPWGFTILSFRVCGLWRCRVRNNAGGRFCETESLVFQMSFWNIPLASKHLERSFGLVWVGKGGQTSGTLGSCLLSFGCCLAPDFQICDFRPVLSAHPSPRLLPSALPHPPPSSPYKSQMSQAATSAQNIQAQTTKTRQQGSSHIYQNVSEVSAHSRSLPFLDRTAGRLSQACLCPG